MDERGMQRDPSEAELRVLAEKGDDLLRRFPPSPDLVVEADELALAMLDAFWGVRDAGGDNVKAMKAAIVAYEQAMPDRAEQREPVARALHDTSFSGLEWDQLDGVTRVNYLRQADHAIAAYEEALPQVSVPEVERLREAMRRSMGHMGTSSLSHKILREALGDG
jgi:hypothetical protein